MTCLKAKSVAIFETKPKGEQTNERNKNSRSGSADAVRQITVNYEKWGIAYRGESADWRKFEAELRAHIKLAKPRGRFEFGGCVIWPR